MRLKDTRSMIDVTTVMKSWRLNAVNVRTSSVILWSGLSMRTTTAADAADAAADPPPPPPPPPSSTSDAYDDDDDTPAMSRSRE
jgi:hypothetical protein